jgi:peptide/nickel transport system substrate-binding protein
MTFSISASLPLLRSCITSAGRLAARIALCVVPLIVASGCGGDFAGSPNADDAERVPGGTLLVATPAEPGALIPIYADRSNTRQVTDLLFERLADLGPALNTIGDDGFVPRLAESWEWSADSLQITFRVSDRATWHDGTPVTPQDVAFTFALVKNPLAGAYMRENIRGVDSVTVSGDSEVVVWFAQRYPEQFFDAVEHVHILPSHLLSDIAVSDLRTSPFGRSPVGSGPFAFSRWDAGQSVEIVANESYHRGRPFLDRVVWTVAPDGTAAASRFLTGQADLYEALLAEQIPAVEAASDLKVHTSPGLAYAFLGFNFVTARGTRHPLLGDRELRRAITRALDRRSMVRNVFDTLAVVPRGPYARSLADLDTTFAALDYNLAAARSTLDSLGWRDADGDGIRERGGRRLSFNVLVPSSSAPRMRMAVLAQEQLRQAGVHLDVQTLEFNAFMSRVQSGDFDSYLGAWQLDGSPGGLRQTWFANATDELGGGNFQTYSNPVFEAYADSALDSWSREARRAYLRQAYEEITQDAAAIWLYEPLTVVGVHGRFRVPELQSRGWWSNVDQWSIPVDMRLPRDRMPAGEG